MSPASRIEKIEGIRILRRTGFSEEQIAEFDRNLPDVIDLERDATKLARYGVSREQLTDRMGGSP